MTGEFDGVYWDESSDFFGEPAPGKFYGESIPDMMEKEGYRFESLNSQNSFGFEYAPCFYDTLLWIWNLPEKR